MAGQPEIDRERVLAYRVAAQQIDRPGLRPADLDVLALGAQDTPYGSARLALAARVPAAGGLDDDRLELVWSFRGAPHLHRRAELPALAAALWPLSDTDATRRIPGQIREGAKLGLVAFRAAADAFRAVVTAPMDRGEVSRAVTERIPAELSYECRPCAARHVSGALFQQAGLAGGVRLAVSGRTARLAPLAERPGPPEVAAGTDALVLAYLRLLGPATIGDVAAFLGTSATELRRVWPADALTEVRVDGRPAWVSADRLDALRAAEPAELVRLLPPGDPYLQARDRAVLVPEKAHQQQLWRMLGNPGALLVDGEVTGTWRAKQAAKGRVDLMVTPFSALPARVDREVRAEAEVVGATRGASEVRVVVEKP
ncbi:crosslink repair DNA glycosylase YcaQ family protein [Micromonospora sp. 4G57]|uniref:Crosslink repair DNA glycosylase YcaQ family protein n=1 Tax=Micromonospora sicca TaxID=2202420 RepID=A0ABU5JGX2_9ACTN|nr:MULTISPECIES: crosslink repair DNA glycosylase YcaQ family protein [unclassified Micromonospora]MDZ5445714.1 crosslink repair DNA glycosylase YcaQ family protein [Micromonospora sp. 4G57]MDZ5491684.1 crosslink repair DNA glycosylase YcaQ family protein [Micromonospora sp. 4G53]